MKDTDSTLAQFDQAGAERLEKIYLTPDVVQQREQIFQLLDVKQGMNALDIGCGPGLTSLSLAQAVGSAGHVDSIDIAPPMLQLAARRCADAKQVSFTKPMCCNCRLLMPVLMCRSPRRCMNTWPMWTAHCENCGG